MNWNETHGAYKLVTKPMETFGTIRAMRIMNITNRSVLSKVLLLHNFVDSGVLKF